MTPKQHVQRFLKEYLDWVAAGVPKSNIFRNDCGLCSNLSHWMEIGKNVRVRHQSAVGGEFRDMLYAEYNDTLCPFNIGDYNYSQERYTSTMHLNPYRIAFATSKVYDFVMPKRPLWSRIPLVKDIVYVW